MCQLGHHDAADTYLLNACLTPTVLLTHLQVSNHIATTVHNMKQYPHPTFGDIDTKWVLQ